MSTVSVTLNPDNWSELLEVLKEWHSKHQLFTDFSKLRYSPIYSKIKITAEEIEDN